ncbi:mitochondrial potassium channel-like [Ruditapes philippinarum]|uniref:mitochondrial potassium channel-like n=1 Tax=Ruditapes philippinarum TaxID=129788 RepID=UPI00295B0931|nr:mitochondrial potassium channel-like [Ruditapes philippinarum]
MALRKNVLKQLNVFKRSLNAYQVRNKSITGYQRADDALQTVTGGRINRWLDAYEDFVGLSEVRQAQEQVTTAETNYRCVQEERRATQHSLTTVQNKIKGVASEIEKTQRGTDTYLELVTKENEIIKEEKEVLEQLTAAEENEKRVFALLSSAVRESHEKERARAERMKYMGIIGSIIGAVIGIFGTTLNNYLRMKELRGIVTDATDMNQVYREKTVDLGMTINEQYGKIFQLLMDLRSEKGIVTDTSKKGNVKGKAVAPVIEKDAKLEEILAAVKQHSELFDKEMKNISHALANRTFKHSENSEPNVVYVAPDIEAMLKDTEQNIEWKMKMQALGTVTLIYAAAAISVPILYKLFGGS